MQRNVSLLSKMRLYCKPILLTPLLALNKEFPYVKRAKVSAKSGIFLSIRVKLMSTWSY
jgi:hypothetical protein